MNIFRTSTKALVLAVTLLSCMGCMPQKKAISYERPTPSQPNCVAPNTHLLDEAFAESRQTLSNPSCFHGFDVHFQTLLRTAQNDPKPANGDTFHNYLVWARDTGVISAMMARNTWRGYFTTTFTSLPEDYRICDYCTRKQDIFTRMQNELNQKKQGFMTMRDPGRNSEQTAQQDEYLKAVRDFDAIQLVFTAACQACAQE
jgi:hypothetical protein